MKCPLRLQLPALQQAATSNSAVNDDETGMSGNKINATNIVTTDRCQPGPLTGDTSVVSILCGDPTDHHVGTTIIVPF